MGLFIVFSAAISLLSIQKGQCAHIIGGKESIPHSRPYMAALAYRTFFCGGTLITENWVLTAAQCSHAFQNRGLHVVLGAHERQNNGQKGRQHIKVSRWFIYPGYNQKTFEHDIMLLKLQGKATINQYVKPIQLFSAYDDVQPGTNCLIAGWGLTHYKKRELSDTLREVNVTVIDRGICNDKDHYAHPIVKENMLCAGDEQGGKACRGDSGDPLVCGGIQRGILSFGAKRCGDKKYPDVYTRLTKDYAFWIQKTINDHP